MSEEWIKFVQDSRTICKYGAKCYQTNSQHLGTYKHPPQKRKKTEKFRDTKRLKTNNTIADIGDDPQIQQRDEQPIDSSQREELSLDGSILDHDSAETSLEVTKHIPYSPQLTNIEYVNVTDHTNAIEKFFLVKMPKDFYSLWDFLTKENEDGKDIMKLVNLELVGPYDVLRNTLPRVSNNDEYLVHWRYFYDPPEFQTIIKSVKGEFHLGYFRDSPDQLPVFIGSNDSSKNCTITPIADNVIGALYLHLQSEKKKSPFTAMSHQKVIDTLKLWAEKHNFSLDSFDIRKRISKESVTKTFHGAGVVVPYDKKTQLGYRPLVESDASLKKILQSLSKSSSKEKKNTVLSELQPVITYANIAMDECDFGTGLELGIDLFCSGLEELHDTTLATLSSAYTLLNRQAFLKIIQMHLKNRRKGAQLSVSSLQ